MPRSAPPSCRLKTSMSPTLYFRLSAARWACAAPMKDTGPLSPNTKPAPKPARTRSRRETSNMLSSWGCPTVWQGRRVRRNFPRLLYTPELAPNVTTPGHHGKVTAWRSHLVRQATSDQSIAPARLRTPIAADRPGGESQGLGTAHGQNAPRLSLNRSPARCGDAVNLAAASATACAIGPLPSAAAAWT